MYSTYPSRSKPTRKKMTWYAERVDALSISKGIFVDTSIPKPHHHARCTINNIKQSDIPGPTQPLNQDNQS